MLAKPLRHLVNLTLASRSEAIIWEIRVKLLAEDHDTVRELFRQFSGGGGLRSTGRRAVGSVSPMKRLQAAWDICHELEVHAQIEDAIFYPAVQSLGDGDLDRQVREALEQHGTVKQEVAALRGALAASADVRDLVDQLEDDVEHHASEEENEMFPRLKKLMPERTREDLALQMLSLKQRMPRPSSSGMDSGHSHGVRGA